MKKITLFLLLLGIGQLFGQGSLCSDPIVIGGLPFSHTDTTANYGNNYQGAPGQSCGSFFSSFLYGNDVVYAYTATSTGPINLYLSTEVADVGMFVYASCADIGQNCLTGVTNQETQDEVIGIEGFSVTQGTTYYVVISCMPPTETVSYTLNIMENTCTPPDASYSVVSDCSQGEQFYVVVDVTSMGDATSLTVSDDFGLDSQAVEAPGTVTFGPYENGTLVQFSVVNDQDWNCYQMSAPKTSLACAPSNDLCANATDLAGMTAPLNGTTLNATSNNDPGCTWSGPAGDVYYAIEVPNNHTLTIRLTETDFDAIVTAFVGDCTENLLIYCNDDDLATYTFVNDIGFARTFYWVVDGYNGATGNFTLDWSMSDCLQPQAASYPEPFCEQGELFNVYTSIYEMGSSTSLTITDNQGSEPMIVTEPGDYMTGPYPNQTQVVITITNTDDASCFLEGIPLTIEECPLTCEPATWYHTVEMLCPVEGYMATLHITGMGTATSLLITDDQGNPPLTVTEVGAYSFGPYEPYQFVNFTIVNDDNPLCFSTPQAVSYTVCPPENDVCTNALPLTLSGDFESAAILTNNNGATLTPGEPSPSCGNMFFPQAGKDIWFTLTIPDSGSVTVEAGPSGLTEGINLSDTVLALYGGDCQVLDEYACSDDGGTGAHAKVSLSGYAPGTVIYVRAFGKTGGAGAFKIGAYDDSILGLPAAATFDVMAYPNPVSDVLTLTSPSTIESVTVRNLLGQRVHAAFTPSDGRLDMSALPTGTYLVKASANDRTRTLKIVKE